MALVRAFRVSDDDLLWTADIFTSELHELLTAPHAFVKRMKRTLRSHFTILYQPIGPAAMGETLGSQFPTATEPGHYFVWGIHKTGIIVVESSPIVGDEPAFTWPSGVTDRVSAITISRENEPQFGAIHADVGDPVVMADLILAAIQSPHNLADAIESVSWMERSVRLPHRSASQPARAGRAVGIPSLMAPGTQFKIGPRFSVFYEGNRMQMPQSCLIGQYVVAPEGHRTLLTFGGKTNPRQPPPPPPPS